MLRGQPLVAWMDRPCASLSFTFSCVLCLLYDGELKDKESNPQPGRKCLMAESGFLWMCTSVFLFLCICLRMSFTDSKRARSYLWLGLGIMVGWTDMWYQGEDPAKPIYCDVSLTSFSTELFPGLVWSQSLMLNRFFMFWQPTSWLSALKTGSWVAPTLDWAKSKNH